MSEEQPIDSVSQKRRSRRAVLYMALLLAGFIIAFLVRGIDVFRVTGTRMAPAVQNGDLIFASKSRGDLKRFDLVIFSLTKEEWSKLQKRSGDEWQNPYVGRIVGLPGEVVEYRQGSILVSGQPIASINSGEDMAPRRVAIDRYFVTMDSALKDISRNQLAPPPAGWTSAEPLIDSTGKIVKRYKVGVLTRDDLFETISGTLVLVLFLCSMTLLRSRSGDTVIAVLLEIVAYLLFVGLWLVALNSDLPIHYFALVVNATLVDFISTAFSKYSVLVVVVAAGSLYAGMQVLLELSSARKSVGN